MDNERLAAQAPCHRCPVTSTLGIKRAVDMSLAGSLRLGRGVYLHMSGGGAIAVLLSYSLLGGALRVLFVLVFGVLLLIGAIGAYAMSEARLKSLLAKSVDPSTLKPDGNYTSPRSWGVYEVERLLDGKRGKAFHFGNHPVRQHELVRQFGEAQMVAVFDRRIDAEEVAFLLNGSKRPGR